METTAALLANLDRLGTWGVLTTDLNLTIVGWNRWLERHSGKAAAEVVGRPLLEVFPDLSVRSLDRYYREAVNGQAAILSQRFHKYLLPLPPSVATSQVMQMQQTARISPVFEDDTIQGTLTVIEDVTERVVTELELRQQAERLEEANRHKDEFLAMLAHELRNPLAPIRNGIRVLDIVGSTSEEARETRVMIERQVAHMSRLVDDLLDVSRIIRGMVRIQAEPCDLLDVLRQVAADYQPILADSGISLSLDLPTDPCWILGDRIRLAQIVANLLHNANKFTDKGGRVKLSAEVLHDDGTVVIQVADTGVGISPETLLRIFESFSQAETTIDRSKGGLGLGLALVKGLTELHGGSVEATSAGLGQGAEFTVRIPITKAAPNLEPASLNQRALQASKKVLLIEDHRDAAQSMRMLLRISGFEVEIAFNGHDGISVAESWGPDVVICDIGLPGLDGYDVARALRSKQGTRGIYLIAQSGYGQTEDIRKSLSAGFDLHLTKPVDFSRIEAALQAAPQNKAVSSNA